MRKFIFLVVAVCLFLLPTSAKAVSVATNASDNGDYTLAQSETIADNFLVAGSNLDLKGTVQEDLFIFGQNVTLSGVVGGNVFAGAAQVNVDGNIKGDLYAGTGNLYVNKGAVIEGDLIAGAGSVKIDGEIKGKVYAGVGNLTIGSSAIVAKEIVYSSDSTAKVSSDAKIAQITQKITPKPEKSKVVKDQITNQFLGFLMALLVGVIMITLLSKWTKAAAEQVHSHFWKTLGWGFLFLVATPIAIIIALMTVIGIPLAFITGALYFIAIYLAKIIVAFALGGYITKQKWLPIWSLTLGLAIIVLLGVLPFIGGFISFVVLIIGLGGLVIGANTCCKK